MLYSDPNVSLWVLIDQVPHFASEDVICSVLSMNINQNIGIMESRIYSTLSSHFNKVYFHMKISQVTTLILAF